MGIKRESSLNQLHRKRTVNRKNRKCKVTFSIQFRVSRTFGCFFFGLFFVCSKVIKHLITFRRFLIVKNAQHILSCNG